MEDKQLMIDKIHSLLYDCDFNTLESVYCAIWNIVERGDRDELRKIYRENALKRKPGCSEAHI